MFALTGYLVGNESPIDVSAVSTCCNQVPADTLPTDLVSLLTAINNLTADLCFWS